jgi:hypothetical protein
MTHVRHTRPRAHRSAVLDPDARRTRAGHLEFDVLLSNRLATAGGGSGALVWSATLTLVLVGGKGKPDKAQGVEREAGGGGDGGAVSAAAKAEEAAAGGEAAKSVGEAGTGRGAAAADEPAAPQRTTLLHPQVGSRTLPKHDRTHAYTHQVVQKSGGA